MDGLSAASGILAVVSLALELPSAVQGLVDLCKSIKDAPDDVQRLLEEINTVSEALGLVYQQQRLPQFDQIVNKALQQCYVEILRLRKLLNDLAQQLDSPSSRKRGLGRGKTAMRKPLIDSMRSSIETVKSTLKIIQDTSFQVSFQHFTERRFENIDNRLLEIMKIVENIPQGAPNSGIRIELEYKNGESGGKFLQNVASSANAQHQSPRARTLEGYFESWKLPRRTPLGTIQNGVVERKHISSDTYEVVEYCRKWRVYPSALMSFLGMRYGATIELNTQGWQYVISPFNAVPEDAKIFEFCRQGDLIGVQSLLKLGQASLKDRDPLGRTPLWVASQSLQLDLAEFLLREGADIHEGDWAQSTPRPPLLAIQDNDDTNSETKRSFISLYEQYHPGDYEKNVLWTLIGRLIMFYRPTKPLEMTLQYRRESALSLLQQIVLYYFSDAVDAYSHIADNLLALNHNREPLQWALSKATGESLQKTVRRILHLALLRRLPLTDRTSMKLITEKSQNLHYNMSRRECELADLYPTSTPTTLALYHPGTFVGWRSILQELGHDLKDFVEMELMDSPLVEDGWTNETLLALFMSKITLAPGLFTAESLPCERCNRVISLGLNPHIYLPWRQHLRAVRNGRQSMFIPQQFLAHEPKRPELVCSSTCEDGFCIAGMYENNAADDEAMFGPDVPAYLSWEERKILAAKADENADAECPSKKMPGAFVE